MFGAGPVTGGSAGGKDYSLSSMMGQLTPHDTAGRGQHPLPLCPHATAAFNSAASHSLSSRLYAWCFIPSLHEYYTPAGEDKPRGGMEGTATGGGAGGQDRLGAPMLSQGAQDLLQGAGVMQGAYNLAPQKNLGPRQSALSLSKDALFPCNSHPRDPVPGWNGSCSLIDSTCTSC